MKVAILATALLFAVLSFVSVPAASDHGVTAHYVMHANIGRPTFQRLLEAQGNWVTGGGDAQTWQFEFFTQTATPFPTDPYTDSCTMVGSIEVGFVPDPGLGCNVNSPDWDPSTILVEGTGHYHGFGDQVPEQHEIEIHFAGSSYMASMTTV